MAETVISDRFTKRNADLARMEVVTPEGVALVFSIGRAGDRASAFVLDMILQIAVIVGLGVLLMITGAGSFSTAFFTVALFVVRNGYFTYFELKMHGRTPGKRRLGLRVLDAEGGTLSSNAVFVRNLTRELEVFIPLAVLNSPEVIVSSGPGWLKATAALWMTVFLVMPMLNRQRRRVGDFVAGTIVVADQFPQLRSELARTKSDSESGFHFRAEQLEHYGIYELQVLEDALRDHRTNRRVMRSIAEKIRKKIGWDGDFDGAPPVAFLTAFYRAQRERLEHDLVLGKARTHKAPESHEDPKSTG